MPGRLQVAQTNHKRCFPFFPFISFQSQHYIGLPNSVTNITKKQASGGIAENCTSIYQNKTIKVNKNMINKFNCLNTLKAYSKVFLSAQGVV